MNIGASIAKFCTAVRIGANDLITSLVNSLLSNVADGGSSNIGTDPTLPCVGSGCPAFDLLPCVDGDDETRSIGLVCDRPLGGRCLFESCAASSLGAALRRYPDGGPVGGPGMAMSWDLCACQWVTLTTRNMTNVPANDPVRVFLLNVLNSQD